MPCSMTLWRVPFYLFVCWAKLVSALGSEREGGLDFGLRSGPVRVRLAIRPPCKFDGTRHCEENPWGSLAFQRPTLQPIMDKFGTGKLMRCVTGLKDPDGLPLRKDCELIIPPTYAPNYHDSERVPRPTKTATTTTTTDDDDDDATIGHVIDERRRRRRRRQPRP